MASKSFFLLAIFTVLFTINYVQAGDHHHKKKSWSSGSSSEESDEKGYFQWGNEVRPSFQRGEDRDDFVFGNRRMGGRRHTMREYGMDGFYFRENGMNGGGSRRNGGEMGDYNFGGTRRQRGEMNGDEMGETGINSYNTRNRGDRPSGGMDRGGNRGVRGQPNRGEESQGQPDRRRQGRGEAGGSQQSEGQRRQGQRGRGQAGGSQQGEGQPREGQQGRGQGGGKQPREGQQGENKPVVLPPDGNLESGDSMSNNPSTDTENNNEEDPFQNLDPGIFE